MCVDEIYLYRRLIIGEWRALQLSCKDNRRAPNNEENGHRALNRSIEGGNLLLQYDPV